MGRGGDEGRRRQRRRWRTARWRRRRRKRGKGKKKRRRRKYTPGCRYKCAAAPISAIAGRDSLWSVKRNLFDSGRLNNNRWIGDEGLGCFLEVNQSRPLLRYPPAAHAAAPGTSLPFVYRCVLHPYMCQARIHGLLSRQPSSPLRALHGRGNFPGNPRRRCRGFFASFGVPAPPSPSESALSPPLQVIHTIRVHIYPGRPQTFFLLHVFSHYRVFFALLTLFFFGEKPKGKGRSSVSAHFSVL